jgi:6-phosphofructokinase
LGRNASILINQEYTGYMTIIQNLKDSDPQNWTCGGCPLPSMMGIEKRRGKNKPVITKYLVELDGPMYKIYERFKNDWALYDCYRSPGPIQFHDPYCLDIPYMVKCPDLETLEKETQERKDVESDKTSRSPFFKITSTNLSHTAREMLQYEPELPNAFRHKDFSCFAVKKFQPHTLEIEKLVS